MNNNTDNHVEINVDVTQKDFDYFLKKFLRNTDGSIFRGHRLVWTLFFFLLLCAVVSAQLYLSIACANGSFWHVVLFTLVCVEFAWLYFETVVEKTRKRKRTARDNCFEGFDPLLTASKGKMRFSFGEKGFSLKGAGETMVFNYGEIEKVIETKKGLLLCFEENRFLCLPARFFDSSTAFTATELLQNAMMEFYHRKHLMKLPEKKESVELTEEQKGQTIFTPTYSEWRDAAVSRRRININALMYVFMMIATVVLLILSFVLEAKLTSILFFIYITLSIITILVNDITGNRKYKEYYNGMKLTFEKECFTVENLKDGSSKTYSYDDTVKYNSDYDLQIYFKKDYLVVPFRIVRRETAYFRKQV